MFEGLDLSLVHGPFKAYRTDAVTGLTIWEDDRWSLLVDPSLVAELRAGAEAEGYLPQFEACLYEPTPGQITELHLPQWAGADPAPAYLRLPKNMTREQFVRVIRRLVSV